MVPLYLVPALALLCFTLALSAVCVHCPVWLFSVVPLHHGFLVCCSRIIIIIIIIIDGSEERSRYRDLLRAGWSGVRIPLGVRLSVPVQTGSGAHPASCAIDTGPFLGIKRQNLLIEHRVVWLILNLIPGCYCKVQYARLQCTCSTQWLCHGTCT
jgi:hypothetical protein